MSHPGLILWREEERKNEWSITRAEEQNGSCPVILKTKSFWQQRYTLKTHGKLKIMQRLTSKSRERSQRHICPSWQPVTIMETSSISSSVDMQWVGAFRPHSTMGSTRLFPAILLSHLPMRSKWSTALSSRYTLSSPGTQLPLPWGRCSPSCRDGKTQGNGLVLHLTSVLSYKRRYLPKILFNISAFPNVHE